jgi:DNA-binding response OmpR family regulator
MPERGGGSTIRQMRRERPETKIVAIAHSSQVDNSDAVAMARRMGADDVIGRPFDTEELLQHLKHVLGQENGAAA